MQRLDSLKLLFCIFTFILIASSAQAGNVIINRSNTADSIIHEDGGNANIGTIVIDGHDFTNATNDGGPLSGSGKKASISRSLEKFNQVIIELSADVRIRTGSVPTITIDGDDNVIGLISTEIHGQTLLISDSKPYSTRMPLEISIGAPDIDIVSLYGSGDVSVAELNSEHVKFVIEGAGSITASGETNKLSASITGSGDLLLEKLISKHGNIKIIGSGSSQFFEIEIIT